MVRFVKFGAVGAKFSARYHLDLALTVDRDLIPGVDRGLANPKRTRKRGLSTEERNSLVPSHDRKSRMQYFWSQ